MRTGPVQRLVKINFELDPRDWHGSGSESLWASFVADEGGCKIFRLENSPFHAIGVSYGDIVAAKPTDNPILYEFKSVRTRSGHSTYMILVKAGQGVDSPEFRSHWDLLAQKGCSYESTHMTYPTGSRLLLSVDVPPSANLFSTYDVLQKGQQTSLWLFQEGYAHLPNR
ncbi:MAG: DUF4265 domain-containing protein [Alphaproteobacteria bacterium]|nr:DUF4265 domain-containing protein [Alphaproteobacteria bacterium]